MEKLFLKTYISNATPLTIKFKSGISFFETLNNIYALANAKAAGCITEELKMSIYKKIYNLGKTIIYISVYEKRNDFAESLQDIAWGTYAWFADSPSHYIHFDDQPSKLITQTI